jgi:hypothetical protein
MKIDVSRRASSPAKQGRGEHFNLSRIVSDFGSLAKGNITARQRKCVNRDEESGCARCSQRSSRLIFSIGHPKAVDEVKTLLTSRNDTSLARSASKREASRTLAGAAGLLER